jgi:hypothetical protein
LATSARRGSRDRCRSEANNNWKGPVHQATTVIGGLMIGQAAMDRNGCPSLRVVVIDPDLNMVEVEDSAGTVLIDTIDHFIASHPCP